MHHWQQAIVWYVVYTLKVRKHCCQVYLRTNSDVYIGLQYTHTMLYQRTTNACLEM